MDVGLRSLVVIHWAEGLAKGSKERDSLERKMQLLLCVRLVTMWQTVWKWED